MIVLPFGIPIWVLAIGLAFVIVGWIYGLVVTKPRERRDRHARRDEF